MNEHSSSLTTTELILEHGIATGHGQDVVAEMQCHCKQTYVLICQACPKILGLDGSCEHLDTFEKIFERRHAHEN